MKIARRSVLLAATVAACAGATPAAAQAATSDTELAGQLQQLVKDKLVALGGDFKPRQPNPSPVAPGTSIRSEIVDVTDPRRGLTEKGRKKINLAGTGFASLVDVDVRIRWSAHAEDGTELNRGQATAVPRRLTRPDATFLFAPPRVQQKAGELPAPLRRVLRATLFVKADPPAVSKLIEPLEGRLERLNVPIDLAGASQQQIEDLKKVDVGPVTQPVEVEIPVLVVPLPIPNLLFSFRHDNYKLSDNIRLDTDAGFLLITAPTDTGLGSDIGELQTTISNLRRSVERLQALGGFVFKDLLAALGPINRQLSVYRDKARFRTLFVEGSSAPNLNDEKKFTIIDNGRFSLNDIEAEDEISSMMSFGLPRTGWRMYADKKFRGSHLDVRVGRKFLTEVRDLHTSAPAGTSNPSKKRKSWGDSFSSLEVLPAP